MADLETEILARVSVDFKNPAEVAAFNKLVDEIGKEMDVLDKQCKAATASIKKQQESVAAITSVMDKFKSGLLAAGAALGVQSLSFGNAAQAALKFNAAIVSTYKDVQRFGVTGQEYVKSLQSMRNTFKSTYDEAMSLQKSIMGINSSFSPEMASKMGTAIYNAVGANADAAASMASSLATVAQQAPVFASLFASIAEGAQGLADGIGQMSGEYEKATTALRAHTLDMALAGKLTDQQIMDLEALVQGTEKKKTGEDALIESMNKQNESVQKLRMLFEDISLKIGGAILPAIKMILDNSVLVATVIGTFVVSLAVLKGYMMYLVWAEATITKEYRQQQMMLLQKRLLATGIAGATNATAAGAAATNIATKGIIATLGPIAIAMAVISAIVYGIVKLWEHFFDTTKKNEQALAKQRATIAAMQEEGKGADELDEEYALRLKNAEIEAKKLEMENMKGDERENAEMLVNAMKKTADALGDKAIKAREAADRIGKLQATTKTFAQEILTFTNLSKLMNAELEKLKAFSDASANSFDILISKFGNVAGLNLGAKFADSQAARQATISQTTVMIDALKKAKSDMGGKIGLQEVSDEDFMKATDAKNKALTELAAKARNMSEEEYNANVMNIEYAYLQQAGQRGLIATNMQITKLETDRANLQVEQINEQKKFTDFNEKQIGYRRTEQNLLETQIALQDSLGIGLKAQVSDRIKLIRNIEEQKKLLDDEIATTQKLLATRKADLANDPNNPAILLAVNELNDVLNKKTDERTKMLQKQAEISKTLREGFISAIQAMTSGAGVFTRIVIKEQQGLGLLAEKRRDNIKALGLGFAGAGETGRVSSGRRTLFGFEEGEAGSAETKVLQQYFDPSAPLPTRISQIDKTLTAQLATQKMVVEAIQAQNKTGAVVAETPGAPGSMSRMTSGGENVPSGSGGTVAVAPAISEASREFYEKTGMKPLSESGGAIVDPNQYATTVADQAMINDRLTGWQTFLEVTKNIFTGENNAKLNAIEQANVKQIANSFVTGVGESAIVETVSNWILNITGEAVKKSYRDLNKS